MLVEGNRIELLRSVSVSRQLADSLVELAQNEKLVQVEFSKVDASCLCCVLYVKENLGAAVFENLGENFERRYNQSGAHDQAQIHLALDLHDSLHELSWQGLSKEGDVWRKML